MRAKLKDDLHALAQAKLDAKRGPILAQALHKVRAVLGPVCDCVCGICVCACFVYVVNLMCCVCVCAV